jgi:hypothetical protein
MTSWKLDRIHSTFNPMSLGICRAAVGVVQNDFMTCRWKFATLLVRGCWFIVGSVPDCCLIIYSGDGDGCEGTSQVLALSHLSCRCYSSNCITDGRQNRPRTSHDTGCRIGSVTGKTTSKLKKGETNPEGSIPGNHGGKTGKLFVTNRQAELLPCANDIRVPDQKWPGISILYQGRSFFHQSW